MDEYPEEEYTVDLGDDYTAILCRNSGWGWNGYIQLPEGHCAIAASYELFNFMPTDIIPVGLTFHHKNKYGFDHMHRMDLSPYKRCELYSG